MHVIYVPDKQILFQPSLSLLIITDAASWLIYGALSGVASKATDLVF